MIVENKAYAYRIFDAINKNRKGNMDIIKINELSYNINEIFENKENYTDSELQGAVEAIIKQAIEYGRKNK
jgi:hypothetical protein